MSKPFYTLIIAFALIFSSALIHADEFYNGKELKNGFVNIIYDPSNDSVFLEIEKTYLNQSMIFQSSLPRGIGSNDIGLDRGQLGDTRLVQFERFGNKILLKQINTKYRASSSNTAEKLSIDEAFADSVIAGFTIAHETKSNIVFDYTHFLLSDIHGVSERLSNRAQGSYSLDKTRSGIFQERTKAFPKNTELEAIITFAGNPSGQYIKDVSPDAKSVTVHMHHSFVDLPNQNYEVRAFHPFSGFWKHSFFDYSVPIDAQMEQKLIPRHRLKKVDPTASSSEAIEPIIYYLDPGIPEPVFSALKEGALWWDQAFSAIGYKNAFQVKVLPEDADPMDIRYNVIQWVHRATRGWSYGSSVIDPRTGEIIKGHVTLGSLRVRQDFLIANGFTSPFDSIDADTSEQLQLALNRIKQLSAHEVGHTLGIAHNFAASEKARASVMDYPHPMIVLDDDEIDLSKAYDQGIGVWDIHAVEYGYQDFPESFDVRGSLLKIIDKAKQAGLTYKSDPDTRIAKRASADGHLWDNGNNPILEFNRVAKLREFALNNFSTKSLPFNADLSSLEERLVPIYYSHRYQLDAVAKQVSGLQYEYSTKTESNQDTSQFVRFQDAKIQKQALDVLVASASADFLSLPDSITALIPPKAYGSSRNRESMPSRMGIAFDPLTAAESISAYSVNILLQSERLNRLSYQASVNNDIPSPKQVFDSLFATLISINSTTPLETRIKSNTLSIFFDLLKDENLSSEVQLSAQEVLLDFEFWLTKNSKNAANRVLLKYLQQYWVSGEWGLHQNIKPLPPGSPI